MKTMNQRDNPSLEAAVPITQQRLIISIAQYLLLFLMTVVVVLANLPGLDPWIATHWFISYEHEFVKRALVGTVTSALFGDVAYTYDFIRGASLTVLLLMGMLLSYLMLCLLRAFPSVWTLAFVLLFIVSPGAFTMFSSDLGRLDPFNYIIFAVIALYLLYKPAGYRLALLTGLLAVLGIAIHEAFTFALLPLIGMLLLINLQQQPRMTRRKTFVSLMIFALPALMAALAFLLEGTQDSVPFEVFAANAQDRADFVLDANGFAPLYLDFDSNMALTNTFEAADSWFYLSSFLVLLPGVLGGFLIWFFRLAPRGLQGKMRWLVFLLFLSCGGPLLIFPLAFDRGRWMSFFIFNVFVVMIWMALKFPRARTQAPARSLNPRTLLLSLLVAFSLVISQSVGALPLMYGLPSNIANLENRWRWHPGVIPRLTPGSSDYDLLRSNALIHALGWGPLEQNAEGAAWRWANGPRSVLALDLASDELVELSFSLWAPPARQQLTVLWNDEVQEVYETTPDEVVTVALLLSPREGANELRFLFSDWNGLHTFFAAPDNRPIAVRFNQFALREVDALEARTWGQRYLTLDNVLDTTLDPAPVNLLEPESQRALQEGWSPLEMLPDGSLSWVWAYGPTSRVNVSLAEAQALRLDFAFQNPLPEQTVTLYWNEQVVATYEAAASESVMASLLLEAEAGENELRFDYRVWNSPESAVIPDLRPLAVQFVHLALEPLTAATLAEFLEAFYLDGLTELDLLRPETLLPAERGWGNLEVTAEGEVLGAWGYGPESSLDVYLEEAQTLRLELLLNNALPEQELSVFFNDAPIAVYQNPGYEVVQETLFLEAQAGVNSLRFSYSDWNHRHSAYAPDDARALALKFRRLRLAPSTAAESADRLDALYLDALTGELDLLAPEGLQGFAASGWSERERSAEGELAGAWSFGPESSLNIYLTEAQALGLTLSLENPILEQNLSVLFNDEPIRIYRNPGAELVQETLFFEGQAGMNSLRFAYSDWNHRHSAYAPDDERALAARFHTLRLAPLTAAERAAQVEAVYLDALAGEREWLVSEVLQGVAASGWSEPERTAEGELVGAWSYGPESSLNIYLTEAQALGLTLSLENAIPEQTLSILFNDEAIRVYQNPGAEVIQETLLLEAQAGLNRLRFVYSDWNHLHTAYAPDDERALAARFRTLQFAPLAAAEEAALRGLAFVALEELEGELLALDLLASLSEEAGWGALETLSDASPAWVWSYGPQSSLYLVTERAQTVALEWHFDNPLSEQQVTVTLNGDLIATYQNPGQELVQDTQTLELQPGLNHLQFVYSDWNHLHSAYAENDTRPLAARFSLLHLQPLP